MVTEGPLKPDLEVFDAEILRRDGPGRMFRVAAAGTNDGGRPTVFAADELHEWTGNRACVFLGDQQRRQGAGPTGAGHIDRRIGGLRTPARPLRLREAGRGGRGRRPGVPVRLGRSRPRAGPHAGPQVRAAMARQANPHADEFGLLPFIERRSHEIPEHEWRRYFANQWVARPTDCWLPHGAWEAGVGDPTFDPGRPVFVGVDMALKHDSTAVVAVHVGDDGVARVPPTTSEFVECRVWVTG